ncbi:hypothetical protein [Rubritalea marina]|uniref:hypothetical protein n=1 Tax=Rubritalea marina TaxID=361055 RepID=UPI0012E9EDA7|nr:hypothetical protein [Rubritalea marina]
MKSLFLATSILCTTGAVVLAETPAQPTKVPMTMEEREASVVALEKRIQERRDRLTELSEDALRLDDRLESKVDNIVNKLASLKDSQGSRRRISAIKMQAMETLADDVQNYQRRRAELVRELRKENPEQPSDLVEKDVALLDQRVEKRVAQVLKLSNSFTQEKDTKKYETTGYRSYGWNGWYSNERVDEKWRQNRRDKSMNKRQRDAVNEGLKKSLESYKRQLADVERKLSSENNSAEYTELLQSEKAHVENVIAIREKQLGEFVLVEQPNTQPVSQRAALDIEAALEDAISDFDSDIRQIKHKYAEIVEERRQIAKLEQNLEARKKWLEEHKQ